MTVDFNLTGYDLVAFNIYCQHHIPSVKRANAHVRAFSGTLALLSLIIMLLFWPGAVIVSVFGLLLFFAVVMLIYSVFFQEYAIRKLIQQNIQKGNYRAMLGPQSLSITPEECIYATPSTEVRRSWDAFDRVRITDEYIFLFTNETCAQVIPQRAFADRQLQQAFISAMQTYCAKKA